MSSKLLKRIAAFSVIAYMVAITVILAYAADDTVQLSKTEEKQQVVETTSTAKTQVIVIEPEVKEVKLTPSQATKPVTTIKYVKQKVYVRATPSVIDNEPYKELEKASEVLYIKEESGWAQIWMDNNIYYVADRFVVNTKEEAEAYTNDYAVIFENMTDEDYDALVKCVYLEALGESLTGKMAVVEVILNRVASPIWQNTVRDVVFAKGQFSTAKGVKVIQEGQPYKPYGVKCVDFTECRTAIETVRENGRSVLPYNYVYFASFSGANGHGEIKIGNQYFCAGKVGY